MASGSQSHPSLSPTSPSHSPSLSTQSPNTSTTLPPTAGSASSASSSNACTAIANPPPSSAGSGGATWTEPPWCGWIETTLDALLILEAARRGLIPRVTRRLVDAERRMIASGAVFVFDEDESGIKRWTDGFFWSPSRILGNFLLYRETDKRGTISRGRGKSNSSNIDNIAPSGTGDMGAGVSSDLLIPSPHLNYPVSPKADSAIPVSLSRPKGDDSGGIDKHRERSLLGSLTNSYKFKPEGMMKKTFSLSINGTSQHLISYYKVADVQQGRLRTPSSLPELASLDISPEYLDKTHFRNPPRVEYDESGRARYRGEGEEGDRGTGIGVASSSSTAALASPPSGTPGSSSHLLGAPVPPATGGAYAGAYGYGGYAYGAPAPPMGSLGSPSTGQLLDSSGSGGSGAGSDVHSQHVGHHHHVQSGTKRSKRYDPYPISGASGNGASGSDAPAPTSPTLTSSPGPSAPTAKRARKKTSSNSNPSPTADSPTATTSGSTTVAVQGSVPQQQVQAQMPVQAAQMYLPPSPYPHPAYYPGHTYYQPHPYASHPLPQAYGGYTYPHPALAHGHVAHTPSPTVTAATPPPNLNSQQSQVSGIPNPVDGQANGQGAGSAGGGYTFYGPTPTQQPPTHGGNQYTYLPMGGLASMVGGGMVGQSQGKDDESEE